MLHGVELDSELLDLGGAIPVGLLNPRGIDALPLRARHLVAGRVLLAFESLDFGQQPAPARFKGRELLELGGQIEATFLETGADRVEVISKQGGIEHSPLILSEVGSRAMPIPIRKA